MYNNLALILFSIGLIILGFITIFDTKELLLKMSKFARLESHTKLYKLTHSENNILLAKIIGGIIILMGIIVITTIIHEIININNKAT